MAATYTLENEQMRVDLDERGLTRVRDTNLKRDVLFRDDSASLKVGGREIRTATLGAPVIRRDATSVTYAWDLQGASLRAVYELKPGWRFVSKQLFYEPVSDAAYRMEDVTVFQARLLDPVAQEQRIGGGSRGVFLRLTAQTSNAARDGIFMTLQNPFIRWARENGQVSLAYAPEMEWKAGYGPFASDRALIGTYRLSGTTYPARMVPEWQYVPEPTRAGAGDPYYDASEINAMTDCVRAFLLYNPRQSARIQVGWTENDYQIDVSTLSGVTEYRRIIDQTAAVGVDHLLYGPGNSDVSSLAENRDAWGWENILWLGLGQKIRKGEWDPRKDSIPGSVQAMLDYAKSKKVKLVAYVYPSLIWSQGPQWSAWAGERAGGYLGADTGNREFQDWFVDILVAFHNKTGIGGYSFDHWWIAYDEASSKYAQWYGTRRILETLRQRLPGILIDGRQQYHWFGPWTWLAGTFPHPMASDEQPGSFRAFPDLHTDRISANRQRFAAWMYRMEQFTPTEITPGYMLHQTQRNDEKGTNRRDRFRPADWDLLGWRYSVISSIASAPLNHVVNYLPARDEAEFKAFSKEDKAWLDGWMDWTDRNAALLKRIRPILGQPMLGRVDGTAAFDGDKGFIFLLNPNYRRMDAVFRLDGSIGLDEGERFLLREIEPVAGRLVGKPAAGAWTYGDTVTLPMEGTSAVVLEVLPTPRGGQPLLFNVPGKIRLQGDRLEVTEASGPVGHEGDVLVSLPAGRTVKTLTVNGRAVPFQADGDTVTARLRFAGIRFDRSQQVGEYDPAFAGRSLEGAFTIPSRIIRQAKARAAAWPVNYTADDRLAPWLGPERILLFVQVADAKPSMKVSMTIDGQPADLKQAWNGVYPNSGDQTFIGWYLDVADLAPDTPHTVRVSLPEDLAPGQFQGLFFDNVETEYTTELVEGAAG